MGRKDSLYMVLDTSEVSSAFTVKTKGSHPFFSMGSTLKVLLLERLMKKKNYFDLRVQKMKDSRRSLPQQLAQMSHIALPGPGQDRIHFSSDWFQVSQRPALHPQWSATKALSCSVWEMSSLTELNWPSQLGKAHPNVFTVSCQPTTTSQLWVRYQIPLEGSRQPWGLQKEHMWRKHQARESARALKNALLLSSIQTCEYPRSWTPCLHKTRSVMIIKVQTLQHGTF